MNIIRNILLSRNPLFWILFHFFLGALTAFTPYGLIVWIYVVMISGIAFFFSKRFTLFPVVASFSYLISFELLARMGQTGPFLPYEMGKYVLFLFLCIGILKSHSHSKVGWILLLLLVPAFFFDLSGEVLFSDLILSHLPALPAS